MKHLADKVFEILKVWLGHHLARAANSLLLAGLALLAAPWWQPVLQTLAAKHLGISTSALVSIDTAAITTGWILLSLGIVLHLVNRLQPRPSRPMVQVVAHWWRRCTEDGITEHPDLFMTVANTGDADLPWLYVHVFPSNTFQLEPIQEKTDHILSSQYACYRFPVVDENGKVTEHAHRFLEVSPKELSIRIFKNRSADDALLVSHPLGHELHTHLSMIVASAT